MRSTRTPKLHTAHTNQHNPLFQFAFHTSSSWSWFKSPPLDSGDECPRLPISEISNDVGTGGRIASAASRSFFKASVRSSSSRMQDNIFWLYSVHWISSSRISLTCFLLRSRKASWAARFCFLRRSNASPDGGFRIRRRVWICGLGSNFIFGRFAGLLSRVVVLDVQRSGWLLFSSDEGLGELLLAFWVYDVWYYSKLVAAVNNLLANHTGRFISIGIVR